MYVHNFHVGVDITLYLYNINSDWMEETSQEDIIYHLEGAGGNVLELNFPKLSVLYFSKFW